MTDLQWPDDHIAWCRRYSAGMEAATGLPPFDISTSDGCTGVRQIAAWACLRHDCRYHFGRSILDKLAADVHLMIDIWRAGWHLCRREQMPYLALPAFVMLGIVRFVGVVIGGSRAFFGASHKITGG